MYRSFILSCRRPTYALSPVEQVLLSASLMQSLDIILGHAYLYDFCLQLELLAITIILLLIYYKQTKAPAGQGWRAQYLLILLHAKQSLIATQWSDQNITAGCRTGISREQQRRMGMKLKAPRYYIR